MKKLINNPADYVDEMLAGLTMAHPALVLGGENKRVVRRAFGARKGKVGIASGGGSGHLPFFTGFVGRGLIDTCAIGNVFEGPALQSCIDAVRLADGGAGVLQLIGNYGGERMNFGMVSEIVAEEGIATKTVLGTDDIASAGPDEISRRRGVAGLIFAYKAAGASSERGDDLNAVAAAAELAIARTRTIGVALGPCRVPGADRPSFTLGDDEIEMGMGIHGEPGIWRAKMRPADAIVDEMLERLLAEQPADHNGRVVVLVNSLGATPLEELFILYRRVATVLTRRKRLKIAHCDVGPFVTSMEMAGASITLCFLNDELEQLLAAPAQCPFWRIG